MLLAFIEAAEEEGADSDRRGANQPMAAARGGTLAAGDGVRRWWGVRGVAVVDGREAVRTTECRYGEVEDRAEVDGAEGAKGMVVLGRQGEAETVEEPEVES